MLEHALLTPLSAYRVVGRESLTSSAGLVDVAVASLRWLAAQVEAVAAVVETQTAEGHIAAQLIAIGGQASTMAQLVEARAELVEARAELVEDGSPAGGVEALNGAEAPTVQRSATAYASYPQARPYPPPTKAKPAAPAEAVSRGEGDASDGDSATPAPTGDVHDRLLLWLQDIPADMATAQRQLVRLRQLVEGAIVFGELSPAEAVARVREQVRELEALCCDTSDNARAAMGTTHHSEAASWRSAMQQQTRAYYARTGGKSAGLAAALEHAAQVYP